MSADAPPFDTARFIELLRAADMSGLLPEDRTKEALRAVQDMNMAALVESQKQAAAAYHDVFDAQLASMSALFEGLDLSTARTSADAHAAAVAAADALTKAAFSAQEKSLETLKASIARNAERLKRETE